MRIERIQVQEGFLDGLDMTFAPELNVIIGARGVGKTSVLELIRYALHLPHIDARRERNARMHAESVLNGGRVTVSYFDDDQIHIVSRSANDPEGSPQLRSLRLPTSLGQNELEGIGLDPRSRLRLIDAQANIDERVINQGLSDLQSSVVALSLQLEDLSREREALRQQEIVRATAAKQLEEARRAENALLSQGDEHISTLRERLGRAAAYIAEHRQVISSLDDSINKARQINSEAIRLQNRISDLFDDSADRPGLSQYADRLKYAAEVQLTAAEALMGAVNGMYVEVEKRQRYIAEIDDNSRPLRLEFDQYQKGAGAAAQLTSRLEQQLKELDAAQIRLRSIETRIESVRSTRSELLSEIDSLREETWRIRAKVARRLTAQFAPRINLNMEHYGDRADYIANLADALKKSNLKYNPLSEWLAERMSPEELVSAVERGDAARLITVGELTSDRVEKLISHLTSSSSLGRILTSRVDDAVDFELLVGGDYRPTEKLSTGQRCSVVLPILLADSKRTLLLDQPEDHLDNAYLVDNTVDSLRARSSVAQTIVVTHNANIPVLGDAEMVFALDSDGRVGYVRECGPLTSPEVVSSITNLMEGGREAFDRRAAFYGKL